MKVDEYVMVWDIATNLAYTLKKNKPNIEKESWQNSGKKRKPKIK